MTSSCLFGWEQRRLGVRPLVTLVLAEAPVVTAQHWMHRMAGWWWAAAVVVSVQTQTPAQERVAGAAALLSFWSFAVVPFVR